MADRENDLLDYINTYVAEHQFAPSIREMQLHLGYRSTSGLHALLSHLRDQGMIAWIPGQPRTIHTVPL